MGYCVNRAFTCVRHVGYEWFPYWGSRPLRSHKIHRKGRKGKHKNSTVTAVKTVFQTFFSFITLLLCVFENN